MSDGRASLSAIASSIDLLMRFDAVGRLAKANALRESEAALVRSHLTQARDVLRSLSEFQPELRDWLRERRAVQRSGGFNA